MEIIQIVLDKDLLKAADKAARQTKQNRSSLVREALRAHLHRLEVLRKEHQEREGYARQPQDLDQAAQWEAVAAWPEK